MKTFIHIGYPKAASTWLQRSLFPAIKDLELVPETIISQRLLKPGVFTFDGIHTREYFQSEYKRSKIISDERFLGSFNLGWNNGAYIRELAQRLRTVFPDATIILFIRRQTDIIASAYSQYIKDGGTISIKRYLNPPTNFTFQNVLKFSFEQLEYHRIIEYYNSLFQGRVKVFLFEELSDNIQAFLPRFCQELEVELMDGFVDMRPRNRRHSRFILSLNRCSNIFTSNGSMNKYYLVHIPGFHSASKKFWKIINRTGLLGKPANTMGILGVNNFQTIKSHYIDANRKLSAYISKELLLKYAYISDS